MIRSESISINGKQYTRIWSDSGLMIRRGNALYEEAIDPIGSGRSYIETDSPISVDSDEAP